MSAQGQQVLDQGYGFNLDETPVIALPGALLWLPRSSTLVVSDLHFEKGSAFAARGVLLPPFDTAETLTRLEGVISLLRPDLLISLGDSFHDIVAGTRLSPSDQARLLSMSQSTPTIWIEGNHDPNLPAWLEGACHAIYRHDGLMFTHEPSLAEAGNVAGHLHPCVSITGSSGRTIRRRCFATDGRSLVMPAFGAFTGGLNINDIAFRHLFNAQLIALVAGGTYRAPTKVRAIRASKIGG